MKQEKGETNELRKIN